MDEKLRRFAVLAATTAVATLATLMYLFSQMGGDQKQMVAAVLLVLFSGTFGAVGMQVGNSVNTNLTAKSPTPLVASDRHTGDGDAEDE